MSEDGEIGRLRAALARAERFAEAHETWEAALVLHGPAWEPAGLAEHPRLVQPLWDAALRLQGLRQAVLGPAREAGRVGPPADDPLADTREMARDYAEGAMD